MTLVLALLAAVAQDSWPVVVDGKPFTTLYAGTAKPYLHPLRSASGKILTRQYPMADVAGETKDHPHHRGLWFSHGDVNGWDFWANEESQKGVGKGKGVIKLRDAKQHNGSLLAFSADWLDGDGNLVLTEDRIMRFQAGADTRAIDFEINLVARTAVTFGDTKEGTFAIRLNDQMIEGKGGNGKMTAADDRVGEKLIWGKRSPWVDYANYFHATLPLLADRGLIVFDNTLWSGKVLDEHAEDEDTRALQALNTKLAADDRITVCLLPVADGVTLARRR